METGDFDSVSAALPELIAPLEPLSHMWDPLGDLEHSCFMFFLRGPRKVDLIFNRPHLPGQPWEARADALAAIDAHFWDWIWWIASKLAAGKRSFVETELVKLSSHLLRPMGVNEAPRTVGEAVRAYTLARGREEQRLGVTVDRQLDLEVRTGLERAGFL